MDGYLLREMVPPFTFALSAFLMFWFVNIFFLAADYLINAHAPFFVVLRFLLLRIPQATPLAFPFACLFSTLWAFGRLVSDNEITVLRTAGVSFYRICLLPVVLGLGMFGLSYWINDTIGPAAVDLSTRTFYQIVYHTAELPIVPQFFRKDDTTGRMFYVGNVEPDHRTMDDIMIFEPAVYSPFRQVTTAVHAIIDGQTLDLQDARVVRFKPNGAVDEYHSASDIRVGLPAGETSSDFLNSGNSDNYAMTSGQLKQQIKAMEINGQGGSALDVARISLAQKFASPCACLISVLLALPLAVRFGRKGKAVGIALAILLLFVYYLLQSAFVALGKNDAINPYFAAWLPNIIMGGTGAMLFWQVEH
ncbi:MAG TPA: LptF/LptG family permease [Candidatus Baltobacteraceae bacterium]